MNQPNTSTASSTSPAVSTPDRTPQRVRHELRRRTLDVTGVTRLTPHMVRITLGGADLEGFSSPGFDDHIKVFFPDPATGELVLPVIGPDGPTFPPGSAKPVARDYTPHGHDPKAGTLSIDFALHDAGPATQWAEQARPGQQLTIAGPRGSFILPTAFDWHLLVCDDTALPAIGRRLAELPAGSIAVVVAEVEGAQDEQPFKSAAQVKTIWVHRSAQGTGAADGESPLLAALKQIELPTGDFHAWVGCESSAAKAVRAWLVDDCKANPKWIRASGYWRRGAVATHDSHEG